MIYKYTKIEYIKSALENGIYASKLGQLNDPYELTNAKNDNKYRIVCATSSGNAKLMWSHYANGHRECCIGYRTNFDKKPLIKVNYTSLIESGLDNPELNLYNKDKKWQYEKEYRLVYNPDNNDSQWWNIVDNGEVFLKLPVNTIYLGCEVDEITEKQVVEIVEDYNKGKSKKDIVLLKKYKKATDKYGFILDNSFSDKYKLPKNR